MPDVLSGLLLLALGVVLLEQGADWFIDAATALAARLALPLLLVGLLTVGIEWEELAVVVAALLGGHDRLALGTLVGASIANLTVVLAAGFVAGRVVVGELERTLGLFVLGGTFLLAALAAAGPLGRRSGLALLLAFALYLLWLVVQLRSGAAAELLDDLEDDDEPPDDGEPVGRAWLLAVTLGGLALALLGGELAVRGALRVADATRLSETTAGLTLVALGATLPDLVVTVKAARRGASPLVLANAAGSNLCNLLLLTGLVALVAPLDTPGRVLRIDLPLLLAVSALFVVTLARGGGGRRLALLLALVYLGWVVARVA